MSTKYALAWIMYLHILPQLVLVTVYCTNMATERFFGCFWMHISTYTYQLWLTGCNVAVCLESQENITVQCWLEIEWIINYLYTELNWIQCNTGIKDSWREASSSVHILTSYFCNPLLTVCIISIHFRYIYSTDFICGQGVVRFGNLPEKYSYSQSRPGWVDWLSKLR